jgi:hypothetical protein
VGTGRHWQSIPHRAARLQLGVVGEAVGPEGLANLHEVRTSLWAEQSLACEVRT